MTSTISDKYIVLVVDDVPENLAMLSDALDDSGHVVLVATDGASALDRLDHVTPDLILLDALMPGLDGFETCRRIKQHATGREIPVVFMTGLTETEHVLKGFQAGGIDYVTKPIQPPEVIARIATHVGNARMLAQARGAIDVADPAVIALGPDRTPRWITDKASACLDKYFPDDRRAARALPATIAVWLEKLAADAWDAMGSAPALVRANGGNELHIRLAKRSPGGVFLLLTEKSTGAAPAQNQCADFHLTPREADVLAWLAKGKTNRDIGDILGMSPRTVNKHLEHIFVKLGVETRSAAAALAVSRFFGGTEMYQ